MKPHLKSLSLFIKLFISLSILAVIVLRLYQGKQDIFEDLAAHFQISAWGYATLFMLAQLILLSFRWEMLLNIGKHDITFVKTLQINLTSQLANLVFITSIGGMVARIALTVQQGASLFKSLIATFFDRLMTLSTLVVLAAAFLPGLSRYVDNHTFNVLSGYLSVFIITMFVFAPLFLNFVILRMPQMARLKGRMRYGVRYLRILLNNTPRMAKLIAVSILAQLGLFMAVFCLTLSSGVNISLLDLMTVLPMISLVASLPVSIGGWGIREGAFIYGLGLLGVPMETAFLISIQVGLISMLSTVLAGIPALMTADFDVGRLTGFKQALARIKA